jgi:hypothetical protein
MRFTKKTVSTGCYVSYQQIIKREFNPKKLLFSLEIERFRRVFLFDFLCISKYKE